MWQSIKAACIVLCPLATFAYGLEFVGLIKQVLDNDRLMILASGFLTGGIAWMVLAKKLKFWEVLEHELTHALIVALCLERVQSLKASDSNGGFIEWEGSRDNFLVYLAPYFLPSLGVLWLPACVYLPDRCQITALFILGIFLGYHAVSNVQEFGFHQPDIQQSGKMFSSIFCVASSVTVFGFITAVAASGSWCAGFEFLAEGWHMIIGWLENDAATIRDSIFGLSQHSCW